MLIVLQQGITNKALVGFTIFVDPLRGFCLSSLKRKGTIVHDGGKWNASPDKIVL